MYSDTLDMGISFDIPVSRLALLSRKTFDVLVRRLDAKGLMAIRSKNLQALTGAMLIITCWSGATELKMVGNHCSK